ncbi:MAG: translation elongation factor-like protein [Deltaproteobacteria bacterium]|nr:translation elongation factor-like protein [Deltaproteobacteria bacterium]MBW2226421.1 translation elongation factor-like protein [Deltaproteobacteria bacterium]MBW2326640.1 translation elongation factor-like protein [Deltaproteobacteria bacterium]
MAEDQIGVVINYYAKLGVAALKVTSGTIKAGDLLKYKGYTTDFTEAVTTMEVEKQSVEQAQAGDLVGVKVKERVREKDKVYKVVE